METERMKLKDIIPSPYNPRKTQKNGMKMYKELDRSISEYGLVVPLIVNKRNNHLISGHQRLNVLLARNVEEEEVVVVDYEDAKEKALCIAMNKIDGEWDYGKLADILEELEVYDDLTTGFSDREIQELIGEVDHEEEYYVEEQTEKRESERNGFWPCRFGEYRFNIKNEQYENIIVNIREKVGFTRGLIEKELERRIFIDEYPERG